MVANLLGLDIGEKRIGVARASTSARLPQSLETLNNDDTFLDKLKSTISEYQIDTLVVGLPRNLNGEETKQTAYVRDFCNEKLKLLTLPIVMQDETLSTYAAEERLGSGKKLYKKSEIDSAAAAIILEDYLQGQNNL